VANQSEKGRNLVADFLQGQVAYLVDDRTNAGTTLRTSEDVKIALELTSAS
jgi:hypothetical protein